MLLDASQSVLLVIDIQERLAPAIHQADRVVERTRTLLSAAATLALPVLVTEQYPKGLGPTVAPVREALGTVEAFEKVHFSCAAAPGFLERIAATGRTQVVLVGTEAHVCVLQTAIGLAGTAVTPYVVADAVSSRDPWQADLALARMRQAGVQVVSTEMVLFEWMHQAGTPAFKAISKLVK